jgi:hypothetical protein
VHLGSKFRFPTDSRPTTAVASSAIAGGSYTSTGTNTGRGTNTQSSVTRASTGSHKFSSSAITPRTDLFQSAAVELPNSRPEGVSQGFCG